MPTELPNEPEWAIVEFFGHLRMAGRVTEVERFGGKLGRIDVPDVSADAAPGAVVVTRLFGASSIFGYTPCTEETARRIAAESQRAPMHRFQLPPASSGDDEDEPEGGDIDDEDDVIP